MFNSLYTVTGIISSHANPDVGSILGFRVVPYHPLPSYPYSQSDTFNHLGYTRLFTAISRDITDTTLVNSFLRSHFLLCLFILLTLFHARVPDGLGTTGCETLVLRIAPVTERGPEVFLGSSSGRAVAASYSALFRAFFVAVACFTRS